MPIIDHGVFKPMVVHAEVLMLRWMSAFYASALTEPDVIQHDVDARAYVAGHAHCHSPSTIRSAWHSASIPTLLITRPRSSIS